MASKVVGDALRNLEEHKSILATLRAHLQEGELQVVDVDYLGWCVERQWHSLKPLPHSVKSSHECNSLRNHFVHFSFALSRRFTPSPFIHRLFRFSHIGSARPELLMIS